MMIDLFKQVSGDELPEMIETSLEEAQEHWGDWLIHRWTGRRNASGSFETSFNFIEAVTSMSDVKLRVFQDLDNLYGKMERQWLKQTQGKNNG